MSQRNIPYADLTALVGQLNNNSLLVRQLQSVCGNNGLARGGVKAELRNRIINRKFYFSRSLRTSTLRVLGES